MGRDEAINRSIMAKNLSAVYAFSGDFPETVHWHVRQLYCNVHTSGPDFFLFLQKRLQKLEKEERKRAEAAASHQQQPPDLILTNLKTLTI